MSDRSHLSIGEVLSLLRDEFPDVTISKIRFLESQGLVDPERTPSGYRKFYDHDVDRLRWILRQQRENFLPLKVIRGRLSEDPPSPEDEALEESSITAGAAARPVGGLEPATTVPTRPAADRLARRVMDSDIAVATRREPAPAPRTAAAIPQANRPALAAQHVARTEPDDARRTSPHDVASGVEGAAHELDQEADSFSAEELGELCGGGRELVADLQRYGLLSPQATVAGVSYFDVSALAIARAAAGFAHYGVEARHLRTWRNGVERESAIFEQVVTPLLRQRNPQARRQAAEILTELSELGADLRAALLQRSVSDIR